MHSKGSSCSTSSIELGTHVDTNLSVLQMFSLLHLTDTVARFFPGGLEGDSKDGPEAIRFGIEVLVQSQPGFLVARLFQELLRRSAKKCSIRLPRSHTIAMSVKNPPELVYGMDDFIDACTRPTYRLPVDEVLSRFESSFVAEWESEFPRFGFQESVTGVRRFGVPSAKEEGAQHCIQIRNIVNTK